MKKSTTDELYSVIESLEKHINRVMDLAQKVKETKLAESLASYVREMDVDVICLEAAIKGTPDNTILIPYRGDRALRRRTK